MAIPNTPWDLTVTRQSDRSHTIGWTTTTPAGKEVTSWLIQRWSRKADAAGWQAVKELPGAARAWTDGTTLPGDWYQWRIIARNGDGNSAPAATAEVPTTLPAPKVLTLTRTASGVAQVAWTREAVYAPRQDVQVSSDGGVTWADAVVGLPDSAASTELTGLDTSKSWWARVQIVVSSPATGWLVSSSPASNRLGPLQPPGAPEVGAVPRSTLAPVWRWRHVSLDGSGQTAAEIAVRRAGVLITTGTVAGAALSWEDVATDYSADTYTVQVRTRGAHASWSPWSAAVDVALREPPVLTLTAPSSTVAGNRVTAVVDYSDPQAAAMIGWRRTLSADGVTIESGSGDGPVVAHQFAALLTNGATYTVSVWATNAWGVESAPAAATFTVAYAAPGVPTLTAVWDAASAQVELEPVWTAGPTATTSGRLERALPGGAWTPLAEQQPPPGAMVDDRAPFAAAVSYRAVAISALGVETRSVPVSVTTACGDVRLDGTGGAVVLSLDLQLSATSEQAVELETYLGRAHPVAHYGDARPVRVQVSGVLVDDLSTPLEAMWGADVYYRDPTGRAFWATVTSLQIGDPYEGVRNVAMSLEQVDHGA